MRGIGMGLARHGGVRLAGGGIPPLHWFELVGDVVLYSGSGATDWLGRPVLFDNADTWIMVYRQGAQHSYDADGMIHVRFSDDEGATWTEPDVDLNSNAVTGAPFVGHSTNDTADAIIFAAPNGDLLIHIAELQTGDAPRGTYQWRSTDGGTTWSDEGQINADGDLYGGQDFVVVGSEVYITTVSSAWASPMAAHLYKSADNGATWTFVSVIATTAENANEASIEYLDANRFLCVLRDSLNAKTYQRLSNDLGATWDVLTDVTASLSVLQRPRTRIVANEPNRIYLFGRDTYTSSYTVIYYSDDNGVTWSPPFRFSSIAYSDTGYCDMLQRSNGDYYLLSYTGTQASASIREYLFQASDGYTIIFLPSQDTAILKPSPTNNYGVATYLVTGENNNAVDRVWRTLIKFDLSILPDTTIVLAAKLRLRLSSELSSNSRTLRVYRLKRVWSEGSGNGSATGDGATWNKYDTLNNWQTAGGFGADDCEQTDIGALAFVANPVLNQFYELDLTTSAVKDWLDGDFANNGVLLMADVETDDNLGFDSRNHATVAYRPQLVIEYRL